MLSIVFSNYRVTAGETRLMVIREFYIPCRTYRNILIYSIKLTRAFREHQSSLLRAFINVYYTTR